MACEVPVISSNAGGLPEVNTHGSTGYLADVGDIETMAKYSIELLKDDKKHLAFKKNALNQAERFDIKNIMPKYEAYYQKIVDRVKAQVV
jgi:glycosyltransferase involved in cell wall biosynthesis